MQPVEADVGIRRYEIEVPVDARFHGAKDSAVDGRRPRAARSTCKRRLSRYGFLRPEAHRAPGRVNRHLPHALGDDRAGSLFDFGQRAHIDELGAWLEVELLRDRGRHERMKTAYR